MISANKKLAGKTRLSSYIFPFRNYANTYRGWNYYFSSGLDGISNQLLKLSLPYIIDSLTYIFNLFIEKNVFPSELKKAKVVPIPKSMEKKKRKKKSKQLQTNITSFSKSMCTFI